jgi:hypothetical protein
MHSILHSQYIALIICDCCYPIAGVVKEAIHIMSQGQENLDGDMTAARGDALYYRHATNRLLGPKSLATVFHFFEYRSDRCGR